MVVCYQIRPWRLAQLTQMKVQRSGGTARSSLPHRAGRGVQFSCRAERPLGPSLYTSSSWQVLPQNMIFDASFIGPVVLVWLDAAPGPGRGCVFVPVFSVPRDLGGQALSSPGAACKNVLVSGLLQEIWEGTF